MGMVGGKKFLLSGRSSAPSAGIPGVSEGGLCAAVRWPRAGVGGGAWPGVAGRRGRAPMRIEGAKGHSAHAGHGCMSEMFVSDGRVTSA